MSGFFDKLNDIGNMLDNVSGTIDSEIGRAHV